VDSEVLVGCDSLLQSLSAENGLHHDDWDPISCSINQSHSNEAIKVILNKFDSKIISKYVAHARFNPTKFQE